MPTQSSVIPWARPKLFGNEETMVVDALRSSWISGGPYVQRLERVAADKMEVAEIIAVSNGTVALELALRGLEIEVGDEVIVPAFTFVAAANMVLSVRSNSRIRRHRPPLLVAGSEGNRPVSDGSN